MRLLLPLSATLRYSVSMSMLFCDFTQNDSQMALATYVSEIRKSKVALRNALALESGYLSDDAKLLLTLLCRLNPTAPTSALDSDLWSGNFRLITASNALYSRFRVSQLDAFFFCDVPRTDDLLPRSLKAKASYVLSLRDGDDDTCSCNLELIVTATGDNKLGFHCSKVSVQSLAGIDPTFDDFVRRLSSSICAGDDQKMVKSACELPCDLSFEGVVQYLDQDMLVLDMLGFDWVFDRIQNSRQDFRL